MIVTTVTTTTETVAIVDRIEDLIGEETIETGTVIEQEMGIEVSSIILSPVAVVAVVAIEDTIVIMTVTMIVTVIATVLEIDQGLVTETEGGIAGIVTVITIVIVTGTETVTEVDIRTIVGVVQVRGKLRNPRVVRHHV